MSEIAVATPFLEPVWNQEEEKSLEPEEVERIAREAKGRLVNFPVYKESEPQVDQDGNSVRQFEHGGKYFLIHELPPKRGSNEFTIQIMESSQPIVPEGQRVDLKKNPDLRQYGLSLDAISYISPNIADVNRYVPSGNKDILAPVPPAPPFSPGYDKEEDKLPKINKKGVEAKIKGLLNRLSAPRFKMPA